MIDPSVVAVAEEAVEAILRDGQLLEPLPPAPDAVADAPPPTEAATTATLPSTQQGADEIVPAIGGEIVPGAPRGWSKTKSGYVFDHEHRRIGRITRWGREGINMSCKCYMHSGKCSLAKSARVADDGMLMQWLARGVDLGLSAASSSAGPTREELTRKHMSQWDAGRA